MMTSIVLSSLSLRNLKPLFARVLPEEKRALYFFNPFYQHKVRWASYLKRRDGVCSQNVVDLVHQLSRNEACSHRAVDLEHLKAGQMLLFHNLSAALKVRQ